MDTPSVPLKQCCRKDKCVHPSGSWQAATLDQFYKHKSNPDGLSRECKSCISARGKTRYENNRNDIQAQHKEFYQANRERVLNSQKEYYQKNKADVLKRHAEYGAKHPEASKRAKKNYRENHGERCVNSNREWLHRNPDKRREYSQRRRAKELAASGGFTKQDIETLYRSQKGLCWWCEKPVGKDYHVDHRIPITRGGSNNPENLCIACPHCNHSKSDKLPHEWSGRLL